MSFTARPVAGMTLVAMGLVDHREALWRESLSQLFCDDIASAHVTALASVLRGPEHVL